MYRIPLGQYVSTGVDWLLRRYGHVFDAFSAGINVFIHALKNGLSLLPWWLLILVVVLLAWRVKNWRLALGSGLGLLLIYNLELWPSFIDTLVLVLISALVSMIIGLPIGIAAAGSKRFERLMSPLLDFMQTMPSFVYLIPALMFFGLGTVPAVFATVIFSMPPVIRLTNLGIRQVPVDLVEVGEAFGSTPWQLLWKIQLPLALPTIMAGINQTMMLSLSMVVIAAMIGSGGFGQGVLAGISQMDIGKGFENGLAVVILAMILDRLSQGFIRSPRKINRS
ncbi:proline/glycine betaine ABC transporter permease [Desulfosporosinus sp. PR]|uniref:ABC transporter permease n=1 Tax=Candidatus Desulfosporosinus nitrosoreducens TaxID=3401928 RepID=UPI0027E7F5E4|nr:proline/glycine betaine ABC transporter permease [Desulfosporosinus sp. PR]MDQ7093304.1 proline/glycine betaine ABC transporter permease [Desulfosporosinus sp. PR]